MYNRRSGFVLAFHGTDKSIVDKVLLGEDKLKGSRERYDWLGHGVYFWENGYTRAKHFAAEKSKRPNSNIETPAVIGAVLDLGNCLDLLDYNNNQLLKYAYSLVTDSFAKSGKDLPSNKNISGGNDLLLRFLDCQVIEELHKLTPEIGHQGFDSVRGAFVEGEPVYEGAGIYEKTHIQICVRNPNCIKGLFLPREENHKWPSV